jgi:hypothetical protein
MRKPRKCKFCKRVFMPGPKASRRVHCYRPECEARQKRYLNDCSNNLKRGYRQHGDYSRGGKYSAANYLNPRSPKQEVKRLWEDKYPLIRCLSCGEMKPGPFEVCFDCREIRREQIDTDWIYQADGSRWVEVIQ